jgi:hypothetical protein
MATPADDPFVLTMPSIHEGVRKSALVRALHDKVSALQPGAFPFAAELGRLRDVVAPQIGDTRILFPEFTPHDEALHVAQLFQLADKLFGDVYRNLKAVELFLLACALYAHDWGMAVGSLEQAFLRGGARHEDLDPSFVPLPDEADRLQAFVKAEGLKPESGKDVPELSDNHLRLYVRLTHARRSGARAKALFNEHPALGQALAHLCEGHWHDFATLDDPERFPREREVVGETANLLALALQVRLIDLFHLTDDRTPYALWRFVSPTDRRSELEWRKHRALTGLATKAFHPGRAIRVEGFTEDEEVWAGLQDLRRYCEDQVAQTLDLSARHVPQRYGLDFIKLDWDLTTGGLRPVDFSFGFDRKAMFRILSEDIYEGEREVFLRELLQNAIDAIRTRRARHAQRARQKPAIRRQAEPSFDSTIYFTAEHRANGDCLLTCRDNGIGMDEHIVRNYFTVAGVSYYRSPEFERQDLGFEPISRFGIGILSCFMVADSLQVHTYRDPDCAPPMAQVDLKLPGAQAHRARRLDIKIPAADRQFIVRDGTDGFEVGTEIALLALAGKIRVQGAAESARDTVETETPDGADGFQRLLKVTEYLCEIAGFVEFPIHVTETWPGQAAPNYTLILHPDRDPEAERKCFDSEIQIHQLSRDYPWELVTAPESLEAARRHMTVQQFELKEVLGDQGYEGWVSYPAPQTAELWVRHDQWSSAVSFVREVCFAPPAGKEKIEASVWFSTPRDGIDSRLLRVYRDGILLARLRSAPWLQGSADHPLAVAGPLPPAALAVNLPSRGTRGTNVARTELAERQARWDSPVWTAIRNRLVETLIPAALALPPAERILRIASLALVFPLRLRDILTLVPKEKRVRPWLLPPGRWEWREGPLGDAPVCLTPENFHIYPWKVLIPPLGDMVADARFHWMGPECLATQLTPDRGSTRGAAMTCAQIWTWVLPEQLQLLSPPKGIERPLVQLTAYVREPFEEDMAETEARKETLAALEVAAQDPGQLTPEQRARVSAATGVNLVHFAGHFGALQWGCKTSRIHNKVSLNSGHAFGAQLQRCLAA